MSPVEVSTAPAPQDQVPAVDDDATAAPSDGTAAMARGRSRGTVLLLTSASLIILTALALWGVLYLKVLSPVQEARNQRVLYAQLREELALQTVPIGGDIQPGHPLGSMTIDSIGLRDVIFVEGTTSGVMEAGPGHRRDSVLPGQPGVAVLFGRSVTFGAPFGRLTQLEPGDEISITTGQGSFTYTVDRIRRPGDDVPTPPRKGEGRLVLATSEAGSGADGSWSRQVVYLDASLVGDAQPVEGDRPTSLGSDELAMSTQSTGLVPLAVWLAAIIAALAGAIWSSSRWGRRQTLVVAAPVLIALLWGASQTASRLLPNLF